MRHKLIELQNQAKEDLATVKSLNEIEQLRTKYLGRKSAINEIIKSIPSLPPEQRSIIGKLANKLKQEISKWIEDTKEKSVIVERVPVAKEMFDLSLPGKQKPYGHKHPITQTIDEIKSIFSKMGFDVEYGPEVELEYYNFDALNIPPDHPSREDFDTFYLDNQLLLRSQTSTVQIRVMKKKPPPIRMIAPGKVFRPDTVDARHASMFHQIEGLMVDEGVSFSDLK
ncbi:MAG: phenylalanine--tRNA ligase subunit alpha, partial [Candidatus Scalinduaceae bacterium]